jgi:hypothetical protein
LLLSGTFWNLPRRPKDHMKRIPLFRMRPVRVGWALVSDSDFCRINKHRWFAWFDGRNRYARRGKGQQTFLLHKAVKPTVRGKENHHIDGDGWNCTRKNLLPVTRLEHGQFIRRKIKNASSQYVGVHWHCQHQKWCAEIRMAGKKKHLGLFKHEIDAANAYRRAKCER